MDKQVIVVGKKGHTNKYHINITFLFESGSNSLEEKNERNFCPAVLPLSGSSVIKNLSGLGSWETISKSWSNKSVFVIPGRP